MKRLYKYIEYRIHLYKNTRLRYKAYKVGGFNYLSSKERIQFSYSSYIILMYSSSVIERYKE
jgi:hypothetical protein